jgi:hypothetical protein
MREISNPLEGQLGCFQMPDKLNLEKKRNQKLAAKAEPFLEQGEDIRALFVGETRIAPIWCLFPPMILLAIFISRGGVIAVTDRNVYQFPLSALGNWKNKLTLKAPLHQAVAMAGHNWSLKVDGGPRLYATPGSGRGVRDQVAEMINRT